MKNNRRNFIKKAAMGFTGISIVPRHVLGNGFKAPSDIFNLGMLIFIWVCAEMHGDFAIIFLLGKKKGCGGEQK